MIPAPLTALPPPDSAIPKALRDVMRVRRQIATELRVEISEGLSPRAFGLVNELAAIDRAIRSREWLPRASGFDPIALGM